MGIYYRTTYRTRTYIAADWTNDKNAIDILMKWNESHHWGLSFLDAHELSQCRDDKTDNCNIKKTVLKISKDPNFSCSLSAMKQKNFVQDIVCIVNLIKIVIIYHKRINPLLNTNVIMLSGTYCPLLFYTIR